MHLDQDADVFEALSVDDIVRIVTTQNTEQSDSDKDKERFVEPILNESQAMDCARDSA
jgi:ABC-type lipopolysaccharide export system ATPase subunit